MQLLFIIALLDVLVLLQYLFICLLFFSSLTIPSLGPELGIANESMPICIKFIIEHRKQLLSKNYCMMSSRALNHLTQNNSRLLLLSLSLSPTTTSADTFRSPCASPISLVWSRVISAGLGLGLGY